jgi:hypothetical protein
MAGRTQLTLDEGSDAVVIRGGLQATFSSTEVAMTVNGKNIIVDSQGNVFLEKALKVGDRLRDGTVCVAVDLDKDKALFAPAGIIGGKATFDDQHKIPAQLNNQNAHGHDDWRNITDEEGKELCQVWEKVAPDELKDYRAPWFWLTSVNPFHSDQGKIRSSKDFLCWHGLDRGATQEVPVVRSGPAQSHLIIS